MTSNYELARYEPGLKQQIIELQSHLWSPNATLNTAYFEWKYERNPYINAPLIYLATHRGSVVGMRGFFGTQWAAGVPAEQFVAPYADDLLIAPEHRNRGLIAKIMLFAFDDLAKLNYQYAVSLSPGAMTFLSSIAAGWRSPGLMRPLRRRPWRVAVRRGADRLSKRLPTLAGEFQGVARWLGAQRRSLVDINAEQVRRCSSRSPCIVFEDAPRCSAMAELVDKVATSRIRHVRDAAYFGWRFQNPLSRYRFLYWDNQRLQGYLVLQEYTSQYASSYDVVNIVDLEATSVAVQAELLQAAMKLIVDRNLVIWSASLSRELTALLDESGFKLQPAPRSVAQQRHTLLLRPIRTAEIEGDWLYAGRRLLDLNCWDLRMLYSMHG